MLDAEDLAALQDEDFTQLGGLNQIRWAPSHHRALEKLLRNYTVLCQHLENVTADKQHQRQAECEGVLTFLTSLKFLKMLMFLLDLHAIMKVLSLAFQRKTILLLEILPLLSRSILELENVRGGKGENMYQFSKELETTPVTKYRGVILNRCRYTTRAKRQARMEDFAEEADDESETSMNMSLFRTFDFLSIL